MADSPIHGDATLGIAGNILNLVSLKSKHVPAISENSERANVYHSIIALSTFELSSLFGSSTGLVQMLLAVSQTDA